MTTDSTAPFAALVKRHRREILAYLMRMLGNRDDAEDVCQEVFLRAHRAFPRLDADSNPRAWLYRIATRRGITASQERRRHASRHEALDPDRVPSFDSAGDPQAVRRLRRAVGELPPRQRAALMLREFQGLSYAEIAVSMGGNETSARANVYQAIRKLRLVFAGEANEPTR